MRLTILHVPDCPNVKTLQDRITQAADGNEIEIILRVVDSPDLAAALGMIGSPTLLVDGIDPFTEPDQPSGVSCRLYRDEAGNLAGAPSVAQLRRVLDPLATSWGPFTSSAHEQATDAPDSCGRAKDQSPSTGLDEWRARTARSDPASQAVHQAVLSAFASTGRPPIRTSLDRIAAGHGATAAKVLAELHTADAIRLDAAGQITVAYPFSGVPTRHRVHLAGGVQAWAMCAVDALGMPVMLGIDAVIYSTDPGNGHPVAVTVHDGRYYWKPSTAVAFVSASAGDGPSADSCCNDLNFFTTSASAATWMKDHPHLRGEILDADRAEQLGRRIFGGLMNPTRATSR